MYEGKFRKRHATWLAIAIVLMLVNILFIIISVPIILLVIIDYLLCRPKTKNIDDEKVPIEENENIDGIRATVEKIEKINNKEKEYRKNVDIRQFKGRNNVTKEEVEKYLWVHYIWEGRREKELIIDEIIKETNLTNDDKKWILNEHYNKYINGEKFSGCWERNEEIKIEDEYRKKKVRKIRDEQNKYNKQIDNAMKNINFLNDINTNDTSIDDDVKYRYYYEDWLKEKGYV